MLRSTMGKLLKEIDKLQDKISKDIPKDIGAGYETGGGWHDNALFESSLTDQALVVTRLIQLNKFLQNPSFIDDLDIPGDIVTIGVKITLSIKEGGSTEGVSYRILGSADTLYDKDAISSLSPLVKLLMGHKVGDIIKKAPKQYHLLAIEKIIQ